MGRSRAPRAISAALAVALCIALPSAVRAMIDRPDLAGRYVPGQVIVRVQPGSPLASIVKAVPSARVLNQIAEINAALVSVPDVAAALPVLRDAPGVISAEPNYVGTVAAAPPPSRANDPLFGGEGPQWDARQWYMQRIGALYAWTIYPRAYYTGRQRPADPLKVAVLDTIIDTTHRDWRNTGADSAAVAQGGQLDLADAHSFVDPKNESGSNQWHGTFVAGLIGASADNSEDIAGIAYSSQIMPVTVADGEGMVNAYALAGGITWATDHGARIINASLAISAPDSKGVDAVRAATFRAVSRGSVVVAAIGNDDKDDAVYPAGFSIESSGVLAVGASDVFDQRDVCSSKRGRLISVVAPDQEVWSLLPQPNSNAPATLRSRCHTSFSTALVSGIAALVAGRYPSLSPAQITQRIEQTAEDIAPAGRDDDTGYGRVNAERALWSGPGPWSSWTSVPTANSKNRVTLVAKVDPSAVSGEIDIDGGPRGHGYQPRVYRSNGQGYVSMIVDTSKMLEGPHEISVRARDAQGRWGPASTGAFIVDRSTPTVSGNCYSSTFGSGVANPDDGDHAVQFGAIDQWSRTLHVKIDLLDATLSSVATLDYPAVPPGNWNRPWSEVENAHRGPLLPGEYRIIVSVTNLAGLYDYSDTPCTVLPTTRSIPSPGSSQTESAGPVPIGFSTRLPTSRPSPPVPIDTGSPIPTP